MAEYLLVDGQSRLLDLAELALAEWGQGRDFAYDDISLSLLAVSYTRRSIFLAKQTANQVMAALNQSYGGAPASGTPGGKPGGRKTSRSGKQYNEVSLKSMLGNFGKKL